MCRKQKIEIFLLVWSSILVRIIIVDQVNRIVNIKHAFFASLVPMKANQISPDVGVIKDPI